MPTKTVTGAVLDQSNHNVPGASVFLTDLETRHTDAIYSGADGKYNFSGLNPNDDYQVQAKYKGLVSDVRKASSFDTRNPMVINLVLGQVDSKGAPNSHTK
ncbi:MAG: carboxypeptidase-like regulatory domain-containing protein [Terriglobia bacterium]